MICQPPPGRKARTAKVAIRFAAVALVRPKHGMTAGLPEHVKVHLVDVREIDPPEGEPVHWQLLTSHAVADAADAFAMVDLYRQRWRIEELFRTMKTKGFDIEGLLIGDEAPLRCIVMATLVAAVIVQQLVHARDGAQDRHALRPILDAFEPDDLPVLEALCHELEGKTARQKNPHPKGSLAYAAWVCARLGGWNCYYGKPGPIVMLHGWCQFQAAKRGINSLARFHAQQHNV